MTVVLPRRLAPSVLPLKALPITTEAFVPFGQVIWPQTDNTPFSLQDAQLDLSQGTPRFYIMQLRQRGRVFTRITRHLRCTQCLGALNGQTWFLGVAPPIAKARDRTILRPKNIAPCPEEIVAFKIPGNCFVKLNGGTWHAGPYFDAEAVDFYNLELSNTNIVDHTTCDLIQTYGMAFEIT